MNQAPMQPEAAEQAENKSRSPKDMLVDGQESAAQLAKLLAANEATQAEAQMAAQIAAMYDKLAEALTSPQGESAPEAGPSGPAAPEAGANPNARPM